MNELIYPYIYSALGEIKLIMCNLISNGTKLRTEVAIEILKHASVK